MKNNKYVRDINSIFSQLERRLLPQLNTCERPCDTNNDCSVCSICCSCPPMVYLPYLYMFHLTIYEKMRR